MLIGITGKAGAGKDTVGDIIADKLGFYTYSFASPIYDLVQEWLSLDPFYFSRENKEKDFCFRVQDLPNLGFLDQLIYYKFKHAGVTTEQAFDVSSEIGRLLCEGREYTSGCEVVCFNIRETLQVVGTEGFRNIIKDDFWVSIAPCVNVVIRDIRFDNEAEFIRNNGGKVISVVRDNQDIPNSEHASEGGISESLIDIKIHNNGSKEELYSKADIVAINLRDTFINE